MPKAHVFQLIALLGPAQVLAALERAVELPKNKAESAAFEFDWLGRKVVLGAANVEALERLLGDVLEPLGKSGTPVGELFLVGKVNQEESGRFNRPLGILIQESSIFGELIGRSLVDIGVRGIRVIDQMTHCTITVAVSPFSAGMDIAGYLREFPLPAYMELRDLGIQEVEAEKLGTVLREKSRAMLKKKGKKK